MSKDGPRRKKPLVKLLEVKQNLFAVGQFHLDEVHLRILADMAAKLRPQIQDRILRYRSEIKSEVARKLSPNFMRVWDPELSFRIAIAALDAMERKDMEKLVETIQNFAKGFAEAGIPFAQMQDFLTFRERYVMDFIFQTYREADRLKLAIEAWQRLDHIRTAAAAQAYAEVFELTISHLRESLDQALSNGKASQRA